MDKVTIKRIAVKNLFDALQACRTLEISKQFRYAIARTIPKLDELLKATYETYPLPELKGYQQDLQAAAVEGVVSEEKVKEIRAKYKESLDKFEAWQKETEPHWNENVEVEIFKVDLDLVDVNDTSIENDVQRNLQNQRIYEAIVPMIK